jgi:hypothetical protein
VSRPLPMLLAVTLLAAAGAAAAQSPATQPAAPQQPATGVPAPLPPERSRAGGTSLNLQLDDTSRRRIMSGAIEEGSRTGKDLPALGEGARPLDHTQRSSPYPKQYSDAPAPY